MNRSRVSRSRGETTTAGSLSGCRRWGDSKLNACGICSAAGGGTQRNPRCVGARGGVHSERCATRDIIGIEFYIH